MTLTSILLPTDFSPASLATATYAAALARRFSAKLTILHVLTPPKLVFDPYAKVDPAALLKRLLEDHREQARTKLDQFAAGETINCAATRVMVEALEPEDGILRAARDEGSDLIMMATRGCGVFRRFVLGSVTAKILHDTSVPVWTGVHVEQMHPREAADHETILCAVDERADHTGPLRWAADMAREYRATLVLVHALPRMGGPGSDPPECAPDMAAQQARERLSRLAESAGVVQFETFVKEGTAAEAVRAAARAFAASLVVIGRPAREGLGRLRSNTYAIIRESPCPVVSL